MKKYLFIGLFTCTSLWATAQPGAGEGTPNTLLSPAFWQARPGVDLVKAELAKGADPSEKNAMAMDPVGLAINAGAPNEAIRLLLDQKGNEVDKLTHDGRTYLFWAAGKGNVEIMEYLFAKGAKASIQDSHGTTPLNFAAGMGQADTRVFDLCLQHGANLKADLNNDGANALLLAVGTDTTLAVTAYFQAKGLDIKSKDAAGNTAFNYAARAGNMAAMKKLLELGVPFTPNAMLMAAQGRRSPNRPEVFQYLEELGIKPSVTGKDGSNALHFLARRSGQWATLQYFIGKGADVNAVDAEGNTPFLLAAASNRDTAMIALLAARVKNINGVNKADASALALAARGNSPEVVQFLLAKGADVRAMDAKGNNLAYYLFDGYSARQSKEFDAKLSLLRQAGLDLSAAQRDGNTAYHLAVAKNDLALVKKAQEIGADINAKNKEGYTALHKAAMLSKDAAILQFLVASGARKDIKTGFNETAYDLAAENETLGRQKLSVDFLK